MDTVEAWRDIVERILTEYAAPYRYGDVRTEVVFDRVHHQSGAVRRPADAHGPVGVRPRARDFA